MSASRARGTAFETEVVRFLAANGFPHAERLPLCGSRDRGDIAGVAGWTLEAKSCRALDLASWSTEAKAEAVNAGTPWSAVIAKRRGRGVADSYVIVSLATFAEAVAGDLPEDLPQVLRRLADGLEAGGSPSGTNAGRPVGQPALVPAQDGQR